MRIVGLAAVAGIISLVGCATLTPRMPGMGNPVEAVNAQLNQARYHEGQGEIMEARQIYGDLLAANPQNAEVHHRLGVLAIKHGQLDEGVRHLEQARTLKPNDVDVMTDLGYAFYLQDRLGEATKILQNAVNYAPDNKRAINNLGLVLGKQGRESQSLAMFRQAAGDAKAHANLGFLYAQMGKLDEAEEHFSRALDYDEELLVAAESLIQLHEGKKKLERAYGGERKVEKIADLNKRAQKPSGPLKNLSDREVLVDVESKMADEVAEAGQQPQSQTTPAAHEQSREPDVAHAFFSGRGEASPRTKYTLADRVEKPAPRAGDKLR